MRRLTIGGALAAAILLTLPWVWAEAGRDSAIGTSTPSASSSAATERPAAAAANQNSRYRHIDGRWWYLLPEGQWVYYQNGRWIRTIPVTPVAASSISTSDEAAAPPGPSDVPSTAQPPSSCPPTTRPNYSAYSAPCPTPVSSAAGWTQRPPGW